MSARLHVVPHDQGWAIRREGSSSVEETHNTQKEAIAAASDLAEKDQVDIVIHRQDGTFRKVISPEDVNGNASSTSRRTAVQPSDLVSVGSRISWGAVLAGAVIALAIYVTFGTLAAAMQLSLSNSTNIGGTTLAVMDAICFIVLTLASMFVGGYIVSRTTAGETSTEAVCYGIVLWGVVLIGLGLLATAGLGIVTSADLTGRGSPQQLVNLNTEQLQEMGMTAEQVRTLDEASARYQETVREQSPTTASWWVFGAMALSLGAAIAGSVTGAGPHVVFRRQAGTNQPVAVVKK